MPLEKLKHKILDRRGWSNADWRALPTSEREELIALEYDRVRSRERMLKALFDEDRVYAESITARVLIELLREW